MRILLRCWVVAGLMASGAVACAQGAAPESVRVWGDVYMASTVRAWETRFQQMHPEVRFETRLMGTDTAMPGLYNGLADIALLGRESNQTENDGFLHTLQYKPVQLELMRGSLDVASKSYAPVMFVAKGNPLTTLTMAQADAIFGWGQGRPVRTWGDVGLGGAWKDKPVHAYTFDLGTGTGLFLLERLQGASKKMNWEIVREYRDVERPDGSVYAAGEQTMDALRHDPYGIAVSGLQYAEGDVKAVALAGVSASRETVVDGSYPLARMTYAFVNPHAMRPMVREFLRFVYSDEGRGLVVGFLPLTKVEAGEQMKVLR